MKINYRPEIDGLRGISIISVVLYHAKLTFFDSEVIRGGFIGVDIFFVISGYLITAIILKELTINNSFDFKYFYERRIRRILPVLTLVMFASILFGYVYLLPKNLIELSNSILYSIGFISNFYFHYSGQVYGAEDGLFKPFLHTWSLSIEEQFYLFVPIIFFITFKFLKKYFLSILILGLILSLFLADYGSKNHPSFTFYMLPTRAWELLAGSILAYSELKFSNKYRNNAIFLPIFGLILIIFSILYFNDEMFHPSFFTILPVIGASLIIYYSNSKELVGKILSCNLLRGIGLISYSLYLWHYPIFAFSRITDFVSESDNLTKIFLILISILISIISFFFLENFARNKKYNFKIILKLLLVSIISIIALCLYAISHNGFIEKYPKKFKDLYYKTKKNALLNDTLINNTKKNINSNNTIKKNLFLVGDSHAEKLAFDLFQRNKSDYNIYFSIYSGCQFILNVRRINKKTLRTKLCNEDLQKKRLELINQTNNSIVIIFGRLPLILTEQRFKNNEYGFYEGDFDDYITNKDNSLKTQRERSENIKINFLKTIKKLSENNHQIILIYPMPEVGTNVPLVLLKNYKYKKYLDIFNKEKLFTISYKEFITRSKSSFELLDSIKGKNIFRVYPHQLFCNTTLKDRCLTHINDIIYYESDNHPSPVASEMINDLIIGKIKKIQKVLN